MAKVKVDSIIYDDNGTDTEITVETLSTPVSKMVKVHNFEYNTRTTYSATGAPLNIFTWTQSFTPVSNSNLFYVRASIPVNTSGSDYHGMGLRFGSIDFQGYGNKYVDQNQANMSIYSTEFWIGADVLGSGTQAIHQRVYTTSSNLDYVCPNSSDQARLTAQTRAFLTIMEFKA